MQGIIELISKTEYWFVNVFTVLVLWLITRQLDQILDHPKTGAAIRIAFKWVVRISLVIAGLCAPAALYYTGGSRYEGHSSIQATLDYVFPAAVYLVSAMLPSTRLHLFCLLPPVITWSWLVISTHSSELVDPTATAIAIYPIIALVWCLPSMLAMYPVATRTLHTLEK